MKRSCQSPDDPPRFEKGVALKSARRADEALELPDEGDDDDVPFMPSVLEASGLRAPAPEPKPSGEDDPGGTTAPSAVALKLSGEGRVGRIARGASSRASGANEQHRVALKCSPPEPRVDMI